jgi:RNA polymerase sigma-70 factor (ECF subfamily)
MIGTIPDEEIITRVLQGDTDIFEEIVDRYQKHVFCIGMSFLKNEADACDFVQEVFVKVYRNLASYMSKGPFRCWLVKIAYHHAINAARLRKRVQMQYSGGIGQDWNVDTLEPSAENVAIKNEVRKALLAAIGQLPKPYQACLDFHFFSGLSYSEIKEITGIPINTIKSNVLRAKQALRDVLRWTVAED